MWNKQQTQPEAPVAPPPQSSAPTPSVVALGSPSSPRPAAASASGSAHLGSSLHITGKLTGTEDLQIDGKVDGPISLNGHQLTVGPKAVLNSEVNAGAVVVFGKIVGNVYARSRVDIKTDGSITGDISTARISIEDGAQFKGRIEIDPAKAQSATAG